MEKKITVCIKIQHISRSLLKLGSSWSLTSHSSQLLHLPSRKADNNHSLHHSWSSKEATMNAGKQRKQEPCERGKGVIMVCMVCIYLFIFFSLHSRVIFAMTVDLAMHEEFNERVTIKSWSLDAMVSGNFFSENTHFIATYNLGFIQSQICQVER